MFLKDLLYIKQMTYQVLTRSRGRLKQFLSELRICFREDQNKDNESFLKVTSSGKFSCIMPHGSKNSRELR